MKKKIVLLAVSIAAFAMLSACGNKNGEENGQTQDAQSTEETAEAAGEPQYMKDMNVEDYITLGEYDGVEVELAEPEVSDDYLEGYIQYILQNSPVSTPVTDRAAQIGDTVNIDYEGKLDGVAFEGGTAQGTDLTLGSGRFIEGFEDGVVGMEIGETKDVEAIFPDPYTNNPDLAGKTAVFTVTVNSISLQEVPELTDEYVEGLGLEGCTTVEEYRAYVYDVLLEQQQADYETEKSNLAIEAAAANAEIKAVPEGMVSRMNDTLTRNITTYAQLYGMEIGDYVAASYGGEAEDYEAVLLSQSEMMAQRYLMMQAIAEKEGLTISDEELQEELTQEAENYGYETTEAYMEEIDVEAYREYLMTQKVIEFITEHAVVKEAQ